MLLRSLLLASIIVVGLQPAAGQSVDTADVHVPVNISLWRGISIGDAVAGPDARERVVHNLSIAIPVGEAGRLDGVALAVGGTAYHGDVRGIQISGLASVAGGRLIGVQTSGLANVAGGTMSGAQVAGLANIAGDGGGILQLAGLANISGEGFIGLQAAGLASITGESMRGLQGAGLASIGGGQFQGIQMAGLAAISGEYFSGVQMAGLAAVSGGDLVGIQSSGLAGIVGDYLMGIQLSGLASIAGDGLLGLQAAGLVNISGGPVRGIQVAPFNIAGDRAGVQLGVVNVSGEDGGIPIGIFSRVAAVPVYGEVWVDETAALFAGVRSGTTSISNVAGVGVRPFGESAYRWSAAFGIGYERAPEMRIGWGVEALGQSVFTENFSAVTGGLVQLRGRAFYPISAAASLFAGPSLSLWISRRDDGEGLAPFTLTETEGPTYTRLWGGVFAGVRVRLTD